MISVARDTNPVFVIGSARSGTTMLRLMLTCHPNICIPPEGGFAIGLKPFYGELEAFSSSVLERFIEDFLAADKQAEWGLSRQDLRTVLLDAEIETYPQLVDEVYKAYIRVHAPGKKRWGDKNNFYLNYILTLASMFPQAQFVHIVRDGRDILCSYRDVSSIPEVSFLPTTALKAAYRWHSDLSTIRSAFNLLEQGRYVEIRYEDLVQSPGSYLKHICEFLREAYSPSVLDFAERNRREKLVPDRYMPWKKRTVEPITTSRIGRWHRELTQRDIAVFEAVAGKWLSEYGYSLSGYELSLVSRAWIEFQVKWLRLTSLRPLLQKRFPLWIKHVCRWLRRSAQSARVLL